MDDALEVYAAIYDFVRTVPPGRVVTYGQVADCVQGISFTARQVGTAMRYAPPDVPWQRVVGAGGRLPIAKLSPEAKLKQHRLLVMEGVSFHERDGDRVDMARSLWHTPDPGVLLDDLSAETGIR